GGALPTLDDSDAKAERGIKRGHQFGVALGEIIVDRHDVNWNPGQTRNAGNQGRGQGLAFARSHLRKHASDHTEGAEHLDVVVALAEYAVGEFANERESAADRGIGKIGFA